MNYRTLMLLTIGLLGTNFVQADVNPHYGSMRLVPSTTRVTCKNIDDHVFVVGICDTTSDGTALHLEEDCEVTAVGQTVPVEWEGHDIIAVNHPVPSQFVSSQMIKLDSEDGLSGLVAHFLVHISANADGSFSATMDTLSLQCQN